MKKANSEPVLDNLSLLIFARTAHSMPRLESLNAKKQTPATCPDFVYIPERTMVLLRVALCLLAGLATIDPRDSSGGRRAHAYMQLERDIVGEPPTFLVLDDSA